ncbi:cytochrome c [Afifella sp. IM 167]|uniref:c-type cytochrome n=1 Tax=Afifella sp. IM 167 TaxID=2033586 RepID=UPI001CCA6B32|nr:cytochrome c [Afifella sp. IM 167]MBZ8134663.1 cytochrome C [Afifella sp. IM 167]
MAGLRIAIAASFLLPSLAAGQDLVHGRRLAEENCARCHAVGAEGVSPMPPAPAFRELSRRYPVDTLWEALAEGIVTGHPEMPEFHWPLGDIDDILAYISSIQLEEFPDDLEEDGVPEGLAPKGDREDAAGSTPR